jgi:hypothetical protein
MFKLPTFNPGHPIFFIQNTNFYTKLAFSEKNLFIVIVHIFLGLSPFDQKINELVLNLKQFKILNPVLDSPQPILP